MRSKQERNQIITSEEKGRLRNHCVAGRPGFCGWSRRDGGQIASCRSLFERVRAEAYFGGSGHTISIGHRDREKVQPFCESGERCNVEAKSQRRDLHRGRRGTLGRKNKRARPFWAQGKRAVPL